MGCLLIVRLVYSADETDYLSLIVYNLKLLVIEKYL